MIKEFIWFVQRERDLKNKDNKRLSTKEILDRRNRIYTRMLELDRKDGKVDELKGWVDALDWVVGGDK